MPQGTVKNIPVGKNFGFIQFEDRNDFFFHKDDFSGFWDDMVRDFRNNLLIPVEFELGDSLKGSRAVNVKRLDYPNQSV